ncbi:hypothetical protein NQ317_014089 [Molorchus minor]|uniref:Uncharacterized protein n=1 Tax=Molorchus minor TaxID=1323400 RepID=A0ABQ9JGA6_9CUCU|nr:hypothetical protein NQ317_014089 [Molorchus minor]
MVKNKNLATPRRRGSLTKKEYYCEGSLSSKFCSGSCLHVVKVVDDQMLIFDPKEDAQAFFFSWCSAERQRSTKKSPTKIYSLYSIRYFQKKMTTRRYLKTVRNL